MRRFAPRKLDPFEPQDRYSGLSEHEFKLLADYNGERSRGISHTPLWQAEMAALQARWNVGERTRLICEGWTELPDGGWIKASWAS